MTIDLNDVLEILDDHIEDIQMTQELHNDLAHKNWDQYKRDREDRNYENEKARAAAVEHVKIHRNEVLMKERLQWVRRQIVHKAGEATDAR